MKTVPEIIEFICANNHPLQKIKMLKEHDTESLRCIIQIILNKTQFNINTIPKYTIDDGPIGYSLSTLLKNGKQLYVFLEESTKTLGSKRTEELLVQFLESLQKEEAKFTESLLLRNYNYNIDRELIKYVFPDMVGV